MQRTLNNVVIVAQQVSPYSGAAAELYYLTKLEDGMFRRVGPTHSVLSSRGSVSRLVYATQGIVVCEE